MSFAYDPETRILVNLVANLDAIAQELESQEGPEAYVAACEVRHMLRPALELVADERLPEPTLNEFVFNAPPREVLAVARMYMAAAAENLMTFSAFDSRSTVDRLIAVLGDSPEAQFVRGMQQQRNY